MGMKSRKRNTMTPMRRLIHLIRQADCLVEEYELEEYILSGDALPSLDVIVELVCEADDAFAEDTSDEELGARLNELQRLVYLLREIRRLSANDC